MVAKSQTRLGFRLTFRGCLRSSGNSTGRGYMHHTSFGGSEESTISIAGDCRQFVAALLGERSFVESTTITDL